MNEAASGVLRQEPAPCTLAASPSEVPQLAADSATIASRAAALHIGQNQLDAYGEVRCIKTFKELQGSEAIVVPRANGNKRYRSIDLTISRNVTSAQRCFIAAALF